jgi:excisionase family DNA binding protein
MELIWHTTQASNSSPDDDKNFVYRFLAPLEVLEEMMTEQPLSEELKASPEDHLMTINEVAKFSHCSKSTVRRWIKSGLLPSTKIGHIHRVLRSDLMVLIKRYRQ